MTEVQDIRYVAMTTMGKPLFIVAEQKAMNGVGATVCHYHLTDSLLEASKCMNLKSANTLIADYMDATQSTKSIAAKKITAVFRLEDDRCDS